MFKKPASGWYAIASLLRPLDLIYLQQRLQKVQLRAERRGAVDLLTLKEIVLLLVSIRYIFSQSLNPLLFVHFAFFRCVQAVKQQKQAKYLKS